MRRHSSEPVFDWLAYYAEFDPGRLAAVDLATQRWLTYGRFNERATRLATALRERFGVGHGDRVAFLAHNSTDHFEAMFACWKLGAIFVPLNWRLSAHEMAAILDQCEPRVVLHDADLAPLLALAHLPTVSRTAGSAACEYEQLSAAHEPCVAMEHVDFDTINLLLYTSGTTGRPKGVIYTHRMTSNIVLHAALHAGIRAGTRTLTYSPLFHAAGLNALAMPSFHYGSAVFVMRNFDTGACLAMLTDPALGITHTVGVPTTYQLMSQRPEFASARFPTLEVAAVGAAQGGGAQAMNALPRPLLTLLEARAGFEMAEMLACLPWLSQAPRGDGHPVLLLPGFGAGDVSLEPLRAFLKSRNYHVETWGLGRNVGFNRKFAQVIEQKVRHLHHRHRRKVSLVGWSLGGVFAFEGDPSNHENIRVASSHMGLGFNRRVLWIVADRLAQPEDDWQPYAA